VDGEKELARCSREVRVRGRVFHEEYCTPAKSTDNFGTRDIAGGRRTGIQHSPPEDYRAVTLQSHTAFRLRGGHRW
jgi:hypothetical protein